jgi:hypothetical protein
MRISRNIYIAHMKLLTLITFLAASLLLFSCQKEGLSPETPDVNYYMKATKNNKAWTALNLTSIKKTGTDTLTLTAQAIPEGSTLPEETLIITLKANDEGKYQPIRNKTAFITTIGLDVISKTYVLINDNSSTVTITDLDEEEKTVEGSFDLHFKNSAKGAPTTDVITFKSGDFLSPIRYQ